jgi:hypothetical protein
MDDTTKHVIELWKIVGEAHGDLWKLYLAVGSAIVGFSFSDKFSQIQPLARKALFFVLLIFLVSNFFSIYFNFCVLNESTLYLKGKMVGPVAAIGSAMFVTPIEVIVALHLSLDALALLIVGTRSFARNTTESASAASNPGAPPKSDA